MKIYKSKINLKVNYFEKKYNTRKQMNIIVALFKIRRIDETFFLIMAPRYYWVGSVVPANV